MKTKKKPPYPFILDEFAGTNAYSKQMFGCHSIYLGEKIVLILRDRADHPDDNGLWLATSAEHHSSLKKLFPNMRSLGIFGKGPTNWQNIPKDSDDFEGAALKACNLVLKGDPRVGRIPKQKAKKKKSKKGIRNAK